MGVPARVLGRVAGGWHQAALAEGEQRGHFKNHLRHFCITEAPSLLDPLKMPGDRESSGGWPDSGVRSGDVQGREQESPETGERSSSQGQPCCWLGSEREQLFLALHKSEFPTREAVCQVQETLNPIKREK